MKVGSVIKVLNEDGPFDGIIGTIFSLDKSNSEAMVHVETIYENHEVVIRVKVKNNSNGPIDRLEGTFVDE